MRSTSTSGLNGLSATNSPWFKLNSKGLGLGGVTPEDRFEPGGSILMAVNHGLRFNYYYDSSVSQWKYRSNGYGQGITQNNSSGNLEILTAPLNSSGAGALASPSVKMVVSAEGNVGIGTTNPLSLLHASGNGGSAIQVFDAYRSDGYGSVIYNRGARGTNSSPAVSQANDQIASYVGFSHNGTGFVNTAAMIFSSDGVPTTTSSPGAISLSTVATGSLSLVERLKISSSGNIGIGTTSPATNLSIGSGFNTPQIRLSGDSGSSNVDLATIGFERSNYNPGENAAAIVFGRTTGGAEGDIRFKTQATASSLTERMRIAVSGNVGIGTTTPTAKLDVEGKIRGMATYGSLTGVGATITTTSTVQLTVAEMATSVVVQDKDLVLVSLVCNYRNQTDGATVYLQAVLHSGSATAETSPNFALTSSNRWGSGVSQGIFRATADGTLVFRPGWNVASGTGELIYCNLAARVIGK